MIQQCKQAAVLITFSICMLAACKQKAKPVAVEKPAPAKTKFTEIKPSATSSQNDFDFLVGKWKVHNRMLNAKNEWIEFEAELHMRKTLNGLGNVENYYSTFNEKPFEGMAVRLFNPKTNLWSVYWMDSNFATMDGSPVTGSFENKVGKLYASSEADGKTTISLYQWDATDPQHPKWSQASSDDDGKTWDWNWYMTLTAI